MQNFLGTCLAIGMLIGGFAITGDLGRLAARGLRVIDATDVPAAAPVAAPPAASSDDPVPRPTVAAGPPRRGAGPERIELAVTRPGRRILVWLDAAAEPLAVDVVDPASAAVILHGGPPRRATIAGGVIARGEPLRVIGLGLAHGGAGGSESLGSVTGFDVAR